MGITNKILEWYDNNQRVLPWRDNKEPYRVWISEIMLQQTRVDTVIPYFNRFLDRLPTVNDLANVSDDELNKLWEGLGYYSRARNLKKAAQKIMNELDGKIPTTRSALEELPGIGPYTSGAISSISYDEKTTAVDGNVLRVFARFNGIKEDIKTPSIKKTIKEFVDTTLPQKRVGDYNQALMEIGAIICLPNGKPKCLDCPLNKECVAFNKGLTSEIPIKQKKMKRKITDITVFIFTFNDRIAIRKRPDTGLLAGLYEYPNQEYYIPIDELRKKYGTVIELEHRKHIFTHKEWNIKPYLIEVDNMNEEYLWVTIEELDSIYPLPTAFKKVKFRS